MSPGDIDSKVVAQRAFWISQTMDSLKDLHLEEKAAFLADRHKIAAAESYLRRALEALFDIGRHILAKRFAYPATEYKEIAKGLSENKALVEKEAELMRKMAGYRNRMVHFYHEITPEELHEICLYHLSEIKLLVDKLVQWTKEHQDSAIN
jgi:uncharacterized protein YutE (UPF0331/DUF86 family)